MIPETQAYIPLIKSCGFDVYMINTSDEYCYYTDGVNIGYAQWSDYRESVSTVNIPHINTGTGFVYSHVINPETIKAAANRLGPNWASSHQLAFVKKFKSWDAFVKSSKFHEAYKKV